MSLRAAKSQAICRTNAVYSYSTKPHTITTRHHNSDVSSSDILSTRYNYPTLDCGLTNQAQRPAGREYHLDRKSVVKGYSVNVTRQPIISKKIDRHEGLKNHNNLDTIVNYEYNHDSHNPQRRIC